MYDRASFAVVNSEDYVCVAYCSSTLTRFFSSLSLWPMYITHTCEIATNLYYY